MITVHNDHSGRLLALAAARRIAAPDGWRRIAAICPGFRCRRLQSQNHLPPANMQLLWDYTGITPV